MSCLVLSGLVFVFGLSAVFDTLEMIHLIWGELELKMKKI
jgi:hypothetical protein